MAESDITIREITTTTPEAATVTPITAPRKRTRRRTDKDAPASTGAVPEKGTDAVAAPEANGSAPAVLPKAEATPKPERVTGHRAYVDKPIPDAMVKFTAWIEREFSDLYPDGVDPRLVTIASKAYRFFQVSDLNR